MVRDVLFSKILQKKVHVTLYSANQGLKFTLKSHFWWDFLFSPFHLKEHTSKELC